MCKTVFLGDSTDRSFFDGISLAFGVFDGVHRGHRYLIELARESARAESSKSAVLTFAVDPDELFGGPGFLKIMSNEERIRALGQTGVDYVAVLPFDRAFASLSPREFLDWTFGNHAPSHFHMGENCRFGCRAEGGIEDLLAWGAPREMETVAHPLLLEREKPISSTRIRRLVAAGDWSSAKTLLGHETEGMRRPCALAS